MTRAAGTETLVEEAERLEVEAAARSWKPYPEYRESGAEWLGRVPSHWQEKRLKYAVPLINEKVEDTNGLPYVGLEHIESWTGRRIETESPVSPDGVACRFDKGDVLFGKLRPYLAKAYLAEEPGVCTAEALVLRPQLVRADYLKYYVLTRQLIEVVDGSTYGSKMPRANWQFIGGLACLMPPPTEQRAIVAFLDRKTRQVDELIEKKRRLIELLQEKRTALISHAVTKGLNPHAPMKPTDNDWLGDEMPASWEVKRLKHIVPGITVGIVVTPSKYYEPSGIPCLRSLNISSGRVTTDALVFIGEDANELHQKSKIFEGDIVVVRTGQTGTAAIVPPEFDGANCIDLLIIRKSTQVLPAFLHYFINSASAVTQVAAHSVGSIQSHYNTGTVAELYVPLPPPAEQHSIVDHLNAASAMIEALVDAVELAVGQLTVYRQALISAAVTGKIDVREEAEA